MILILGEPEVALLSAQPSEQIALQTRGARLSSRELKALSGKDSVEERRWHLREEDLRSHLAGVRNEGIVATGAGLHVAAYFIEHKAHISSLATVLSVAVPVGVFLGLIYALYCYLVRRFDLLHVWLLIATAGVVAVAVTAAVSGINMAGCLVILMLAPAVTVVGYEVLGYRYQAAALAD